MAECHLCLNMTEIREKEKAILIDAPISSSGLFGDTVNTVVNKFKKRSQPCRACELASAPSSRECPAPRKEPVGRPYTVWGASGRSATRQHLRKRVYLKRPNKPPAAASSGHFRLGHRVSVGLCCRLLDLVARFFPWASSSGRTSWRWCFTSIARGLLIAHTEQTCAPASSLATGQFFFP